MDACIAPHLQPVANNRAIPQILSIHSRHLLPLVPGMVLLQLRNFGFDTLFLCKNLGVLFIPAKIGGFYPPLQYLSKQFSISAAY